MPKSSRQKFKYLKNEKSFWDEIKSIFHQNRLRPESAPLKTAHQQNGILGLYKKHWNIHVFVWMVKKGLAALELLLTQQILLFEHFTENDFTTCG